MKTIAIGDIHGKTIWKEIVAKNLDADRIVFIGDYFDNYENSDTQQQIDNFKEIVELKKSMLEKVVLLVGNHDYHYLPDVQEQYSGYQTYGAYAIQTVLESALPYLQMVYRKDSILFSHAGVTKTWCEKHKIKTQDVDIDTQINNLFDFSDKTAFKFVHGGSVYGDNIFQSCIWVRPSSLVKDRVENYIQVVGHTQQKKITNIDGIILIDALDYREYLVIEGTEIKVEEI